VVLELGPHRIHADVYNYWLSRNKDLVIRSYTDIVDTPEFWASALGRTAARRIEEQTRSHAENVLVGLYLFNYFGLRMTRSDFEPIDNFIDDQIMSHPFNGNRAELNRTLLDVYGINISRLRQIFVMEQQFAMVHEHLFSARGPYSVTHSDVEDFFNAHYTRFNFIYISSRYRVVLDEEGRPVTDRSGNVELETLTDDEIEERTALVEELVERLQAGEDFHELFATYSDSRFDTDNAHITRYGFYFCSEDVRALSGYFSSDMLAQLLAGSVGDVINYDSGDGFIINVLWELEERAYNIPANGPMFANINTWVRNYMMRDIFQRNTEDIVINEDFMSRVCAIFARRGLSF